LVRPDVLLSKEISSLTGITESMLVNGISEAEAMNLFYAFCGGDDAVLIAHNASFDISFLKAAAKRSRMNFRFTVVDTLVMARAVYNGLKNYKLATWRHTSHSGF
jgi:DNA polymerase-3 subunit alpha (Gram-positive type)